MIGVYKIISPTNRDYIGQSRDLIQRKSHYKYMRCKGQPKLYHSLVKYGWEYHSFEIIHQLPEDIGQDTLNEYEILYCNQYRRCGFKMLNVKEPGSSGKVAEETKRKISKSSIGKQHSDGAKQKIRETNLGRKKSDETKRKISEANKGRVIEPRSEETRRRMSEARKGKPGTWIGKKHSEDSKAKMKKSKKKEKCVYCGIGISVSNIGRHQKKCKEEQKKHIVDIMEADEKDGFYA